jgi:diguanylate cyclase (GGDEF)-like protein
MRNNPSSESGQARRSEASSRQAMSAGVIVACIMVATVALARWADLPLGEVKPFVPAFLTTVTLIDALTAFLLARQARMWDDPFPRALANAYLFTSIMAAVQFLVFPGVFTPHGLLGAGPQSAVWIWAFWHGGFPTFAAVAALATRWGRFGQRLARALPYCALVSAALLISGALYHGGVFPAVIASGSYGTLIAPIGAVVIAVNLVALATYIIFRRSQSPLDLWLAVALVASLADASLTLAAGARYTLGWYGARGLSLLSSGVVLCMLIREITQLYEQLIVANATLSRQAYTDILTGVANRQAFERRWMEECMRAGRENSALSVLMIDIDHFKQINDGFGHEQGDVCLTAVGKVLRETLQRRATDFVARYGGEEFVAVLPGTDANGAAHVAEMIRSAIEAERIQGNPERPGTGRGLTVSIGHATLQPRTGNPSQRGRSIAAGAAVLMLRSADSALYQAKHGGRNRVVASPRLEGDVLDAEASQASQASETSEMAKAPSVSLVEPIPPIAEHSGNTRPTNR